MKRRLLIALLVALSLPLMAIALLSTEAGSRWLLNAASRAAGDGFRYQSVRGDLLSELRFSELEVRASGHHIQASEFFFSWRPLALLGGRLHVQQLSVTGVDYSVPESRLESAAAGERKGELSIPVAIRVDDVRIGDVLVRRGDQKHRVDRVLLERFSVDGNILTLARVEVMADILQLTAHGHVEPSPPYAVEAGIAWSLRLPDGVRAEGVGNLSGTLEAIRIEHAIRQPFTLNLVGTVAPLDDPLRLDLNGQWDSFTWPLRGPPEFSSQSGTFTARGNLRQLVLGIEASLDSESIPARSLSLDADVKRPGDDIEASLRWSVLLADGKEAKGGGTIGGDAARIRINHVLETPFRFSTQGDVGLAGQAPELSLRGEWRNLRWPLTAEPALRSDSGSYRVSGIPEDLQIELKAAARSKAAQIEGMDLEIEGMASAAAPFPFDMKLRFTAKLPQNVEASGRASLKGNAEKIEIDGSLQQPASFNARGDIAFSNSSPKIDLRGDWQNLRWPLYGDADIESASGSFTVSGPIEQLALKLEAKASGRRLPPMGSRLNAQVRPSGARIHALIIETLGGEIRVAGDVGWQPAPSWNLEVSASALKPERYFDQWPGEVSLMTGVSGQVEAGSPKLKLERLNLNGRLRGHPVAASGEITLDGTEVSARNLNLRSGDNRVEINGDAGDLLNLGFVIDAPDLSAVAPDLDGRLDGEGRLEGTRAQPRLVGNLSGGDLRWKNRIVETLTLDVNMGTAPGYRSRFALDAGGIRVDGKTLGNASVSGDGTLAQHRVSFDFSAAAGSLSAKMKGSYRDHIWTGTLRSAIDGNEFGKWRMPDAAALTASPDQLRLERFCLLQERARICVAGRWQALDDAIDAEGEITNIPLALAKPFLPEGVQLEGQLNGEFNAGGTLNAPRGEGRIVAGTGRLIYEPGAGLESAEFDYRDGRIDVSYAPSGARFQAALDLNNAGKLSGNVQIGPFGEDTAPALEGRVEADFSDIGWIGVMAPRLVDVRGRLNASLNIAGTLASPIMAGELVLKDGNTKVPDLGLEISRVNLDLRGDRSGRVLVEGELSSGGGQVKISGRSTLLPERRRLDLEVTGNEFEVAKLPTVHAYVSPDLRLTADPTLAELTGRVHVPRARIRLKELPQTAVKVSEDEVIVDGEQSDQSQRARVGPSVRIKVELSLGEEVRFDGFGLSTGIEGKLAVSGETGQSPQAQGVLSLREGRYKAYGQNLEIRTGRLLFAGPIDNPGIDVTAVRVLEDVTAGIVVGGTVKSLESNVFSEPPLPEADALSYLLTGRSLSAGREDDGAMLQNAATALGLNRAQVITEQIGNTLGLDELTVSGAGVDETSLLLGKQITPDIFIRYALGVFEQSGKLLLDYRLTDSVSVQAESGEQQGVDIIYKIERERLF